MTAMLFGLMRPFLRSLAALAAIAPIGAQAEHWSYIRPIRTATPSVGETGWIRNDIDAFVLRRLEHKGLDHAQAAERSALIRRVSLDLTGLPPTLETVDAFLKDASPEAYRKVVERLLRSPAYGERWAQFWLDLARYADTKGYEKDSRRTIWPYRDWVIDAFNRDQPFDQFTIEQIAGDLLPNPTTDQVIATAFHRNTMTNDEGGTDDEEFRVAAVVDRVNTTMEIWMGTTFGCSQCHDHKFDPFSQREYFQFYALLNNTEDQDRPNETPVLDAHAQADRPQARILEAKIDRIETLIREGTEQLDVGFDAWLKTSRSELATRRAQPITLSPWHHKGPFAGKSFAGAHKQAFEPERSLDAKQDLSTWTAKPNWIDGKVHQDLKGANSANYLYRSLRVTKARTVNLSLGSDDSIKVWHQGKLVLNKQTSRGAAANQEHLELKLSPGDNEILIKIVNGGGPSGFYFAILDDGDKTLTALLDAPSLTPTQVQQIHAIHRASIPSLRDPLAEAKKRLAAIPRIKIPIMHELSGSKRRTTQIHIRGSFLDKGDRVHAAVPKILHPLPTGNEANRLGLARWLVSRDNPLTARVIVNRLWEQLFGNGLVTTLEDFGHQGERPSHPALLDWLAVEFMDKGWSMKRILQTIVLSSTYRQSTTLSAKAAEVDPYNRLFTRGPRCRLTAEMVRDQALQVSGLLDRSLHGPSVMPVQPEGIWQIVYSADRWKTSVGESRHRRSLYTFWRRTSPYPTLTTFDAPSREFCVGRRGPTNTPLQALVTLNDPVFVEAAQSLARRAYRGAKGKGQDVAALAFRLCTGRHALQPELDALLHLYKTELNHYQNHPKDALKMATVPLGPIKDQDSDKIDIAKLAAWTVVGNVLLSLDETLTRN